MLYQGHGTAERRSLVFGRAQAVAAMRALRVITDVPPDLSSGATSGAAIGSGRRSAGVGD
jgi:hypothetical protein